ncbi:hypothetical protein GCM10017044_12110 [Kordiimonas sediminis]|uniref:Peptidase A2 domain-containing protein n=1 Tax=Kordiimonas sediminis TaxID=1735581 RepID=A0A919APP6_9PROT|nr:hypothetical protein GCM10017044_12110 [Kordiimonas sediminis]
MRPFAVLLYVIVSVQLLTGSQYAAATDDAGSAPFIPSRETVQSEGRPVTLVRIGQGGVGYPFIVDTGASRTVLYRSLATELGLEALPMQSRAVITATGTQEMSLYKVGVVQIFGYDFDLRDTVAMPDPKRNGVFGLVGVDVLRGRVLLLEKGQPVTLAPDLSALSGDGWQSVQGRPVGYGSIAVDVQIDGETIPAILDTGASVTVLNPAAALLLEKHDSTVTGADTPRVEASGRGITATTVPVGSIKLGDVTFRPGQIMAAPLPVFRAFGAGRAAAVIIGMDILGQYDTALDFRGWSLWIRPAS